MAGARQNTGQEAIVNLSKKLDEMVNVVAEQYEQQTSILSSLEVTMKSEIPNELKKQTSILMAIEAKIGEASKTPSVDTAGMKDYAAAFGSMAQAILDLIEKADEKAGDQLEKFFTKLADGINRLIENVDKEKAKALAQVVETITTGVIFYGLFLTLAIPLLITANIGAYLFGLSVKLMILGAGQVSEESIAALYLASQMGLGVLWFGLVMTLYVPLAIPAFLGALAFAYTVRLMIKAVGDPGDYEPKFEAMRAAIGLAWGMLVFGFFSSLYAVFAIPAFVGAMAFAFTVRLMLKAVGQPSTDSIEQMKAVIGLGWGMLVFGVVAALYTIVAVPAMLGAGLFGLTIRLLLKAAGTAKEGQREAIEAVSGLGWGVLWFGLAMAFYTIIGIPAMLGAVMFGLTIRLLLWVAGAAEKEQADAIAAISSLWKGVLLFGLAMGLWLIIGIPAMIGAVFFGITAYITMLVLKEYGKHEEVDKGIKGLFWAAGAVALFGLVFVLFNKFVTFEAVLFTIGTMALTALVFFLIGKGEKEIKEGGQALLWAAGAVAAMGIAMIVWMKAETTWEAIGMLGATIVGMGLIATVAGKFAKDIEKGAIALLFTSAPVIAMATGMAIWMAAGVTWEGIALLGATIIAMGAIGAVAGIGPVPGFIVAGSLALTAAALPVGAMSLAMMAWMAAGVKMPDVGVLGATIAMIGVEMGIFGLASPFIVAGSAAMTIAAVPLVAITGAVAVFKASGFKQSDADTLEYTLNSIVAGFLGGRMPGGILDMLEFAASAAARAALLFVSVPAFLFAGVALIPLATSLLIFKKADFKTTDADNLEYALGAVVRAFGIVTDYERQKKMGFYVNPWDLALGIEALSGAGRVLAGLAEGVQAWANLEVNEWEVINPGTKDAKLVISNRRKLNKSDFEDAAYGMGQVISAIAAPFAKVGRLEKGPSSGDPFYDAIFGGGFVSAGISALKRSGDTLVSLAEGVQAFANLEITSYVVANPGTKDAVLVPSEKRRMTDDEIKAAGDNIAKIITVVAGAFAQIGYWEKNSEGIFSGGYVTKGVQALAGVGDILTSVTDGVIKMAYNEIPQFTLIDGGTKDAKLVPAEPLRITDSMLVDAAYNIGEILGVVAGSIAEIGRMQEESDGWFSDGYVEAGVKALGNVGDVVAKIADAVIKFATGEIPQFTLINGGTKDAKLVPAQPLKLSSTMLKDAAHNIGEILMIMGKEVAKYGTWVEETSNYGVNAAESIDNVVKVITTAAKGITEWMKVQKPEEAADSIKLFFTKITDIFDPKKDPQLAEKSKYFQLFAENVKALGANSSQIAKVADNMDSIQKSMKLFQTHVNGLDLKKLTLTDSMFNAIAAIAKNPDAIAASISKSMNKSFEALIKALKELAAANTPAGGGGGGGGGGTSTLDKAVNWATGKDDKSKDQSKTQNKSQPPAGVMQVFVTNIKDLR